MQRKCLFTFVLGIADERKELKTRGEKRGKAERQNERNRSSEKE